MLDIFLRGRLDGIDTAEIIRREYDTQVIFLTTHSDSRTRQRARSAEPSGYLIKPFEEEELLAAIEVATGPISNRADPSGGGRAPTPAT